jgi:hypothetical protein
MTKKERDNIERRAVDYTKRKSINFIGVRKKEVQSKNSTFMIRKILLFAVN